MVIVKGGFWYFDWLYIENNSLIFQINKLKHLNKIYCHKSPQISIKMYKIHLAIKILTLLINSAITIVFIYLFIFFFFFFFFLIYSLFYFNLWFFFMWKKKGFKRMKGKIADFVIHYSACLKVNWRIIHFKYSS